MFKLSAQQQFYFISSLVYVLSLSACSNVPDKEVAPPPMTVAEMEEYVNDWKNAKPRIDRLLALEADLKVLIKELGGADLLTDAPIAQIEIATVEKDQPTTDVKNTPILTKSIELKDNVTTSPAGVSQSYSAPMPESGGKVMKDNVAISPAINQYPNAMPKHTTSVTKDNVILKPVDTNIASKPQTIDDDLADSAQMPFNYAIHFATFTTAGQAKSAWQRFKHQHATEMKGKYPKLTLFQKDNVNLRRLIIGPFDKQQAKAACKTMKANQYCAVVQFEGSSL